MLAWCRCDGLRTGSALGTDQWLVVQDPEQGIDRIGLSGPARLDVAGRLEPAGGRLGSQGRSASVTRVPRLINARP
jgi:hypothetical protein